MMCIFYNDTAVEKNFLDGVNENVKKYESSKYFLHSKSETSTKILQMIIEMGIFCMNKQKNYEWTNTNEKFVHIFNLYNESLRLFTISDNIYLKQIKNLVKFDEINSYSVNSNFQIGGNEMGIFEDFKTNHELIISQFFAFNNATNFSAKVVNLLSRLSSNIFNSLQTRNISNTQADVFIFNINNKNSKFIKYLIEELKATLKFLNFMKSENSIEILVESLKKISFDIILVKFLESFSYFEENSFNRLDNQSVDYIFKFLSIFCLSRKGLIYFIRGNIPLRILKFFSNYKFEVIKFLYLIVKSAKKFNVDLSESLFIEILQKENSNFWKGIKENDSNNNIDESENSCQSQLIIYQLYFMKIINSVSYCFTYETLNKIKTEIKDAILSSKSSGILNLENFKKIINEAKEEIGKSSTPPSSNNKLRVDQIVHITSTPISFKEKTIADKFILNRANKDCLLNEEVELINLNDAQTNTLGIKINNFTDRTVLKTQNLTEFKILLKFYFSFFQLISERTLYVVSQSCDFKEKEKYLELIDFLNEPLQIFLSLSNPPISIGKRKILFSTIRTYFFIDHMDQFNITSKPRLFSNSRFEIVIREVDEEFKNFIENLSDGDKEIYKVDDYYRESYKKEYLFMMKLKKQIENFSEEIKNFPLLKEKDNNCDKYLEYVVEILLSVKYISEYIMIEDNFWNGVLSSLMNIAKILLINFNFLCGLFDKAITLDISTTINSPSNSLNSPTYKELNKKEINKIICEIIDIVLPDRIKYNLFEKFLYKNEKFKSINFSSNTLVKNRNFKVFLEKRKNLPEKQKSNPQKISSKLKEKFVSQFSDSQNSTFIQLISIKYLINKCNYLEETVFLFLFYFYHLNEKKIKEIFTYLTLINKMLFYNTVAVQEQLCVKLLEDDEKDDRILALNHIRDTLNEYLNFNYSSSKNYFNDVHKNEVLLFCQEIVHFYQLLAENRNQKFLNIIFERDSIFGIICENLGNIKNCMDLEYSGNVSLPYDIFIIHINNFLECFIEFVESADEEKFEQIVKLMNEEILEGLISAIFNLSYEKEEENVLNTKNINLLSSIRRKILCFFKNKLFKFFITYLESEKKLDIEQCLSFIGLESLHEELFLIFRSILKNEIFNNRLDRDIWDLPQNKFIKKLEELYVKNSEFRDSLQMEYCLRIIQFIKVLYKKYGIEEFSKYLEDNGASLKYSEKGKPIFNEIVQPTDINYILLLGYKFYFFLERIIVSVEISNQEQISLLYFRRPIITYHLTEETKFNYLKNVNRDDVYNKLISLIGETNYFIIEMIYNFHSNNVEYFGRLVGNLNYFYVEILNYVFIIIHQIFLVIDFYKMPNEIDSIYNLVNKSDAVRFYLNNFVLGLIQCFFLGMVLILWIIYKFPLKYHYNLMKSSNTKIQFKNHFDEVKDKSSTQSIFLEEIVDPHMLINQTVNNLKKLDKFKAILNSVFLNNEVNLMILTLILTIIYLIIRNPLLLVIPTFTIANLIPTLKDIFLAMKMRYKQLITVLLFTYLTIYFFVWVSLLFLSNLFIYNDVMDGEVRNKCLKIF